MNQTTNNHLLYITLTLIATTILSTAILSSISASATTSTSTASVTVGSACTITATVNTPHTAEVSAGSNRTDIGSTTINTICNDSGGFSLYAVGYSNNEFGNNKMLNGTNYEFSTGTATSGATSGWSMKLNQITTGDYAIAIDNNFSTYSNIPSAYTKIAHRNSITDTPNTTSPTGSSISLTYATYISPTQNTGTYEGKVKFTLVHPASEVPTHPETTQAGKICYYPNGSSVEGTMGCQTVSTSATSATLLAGNFSRTGYGFAGWSDAYDYTINSSAHFYGPQEYITFEAGQYTGSNLGLSLYAVWIKSAGNLQDSSKVATLCGTGSGSLTTAPTDGTTNLSSVSALTDQRDGQTYAIAKLADGNCWMIENLRLEAENTRGDANKALAQGYGASATYGNFSGLADAESANFTGSTSSATDPTEPNSLYYAGAQSGTATIDISQTNYAGYRIPRYDNTNTQSRASNPSSNGVAMYSYGNYYTWAAAMANTIYYNNPTSTDANGKTSETVNTSICPFGWKLPRGGDKTREATNDFWALVVTGTNGGTNPVNYDSSTQPYYTGSSEGWDVSKKLRAFPNNFLYSGNFSTSSANNRGSDGRYWSSTVSNSVGSYTLRLDYFYYVYPGTSTNEARYRGYSIRCMIVSGS